VPASEVRPRLHLGDDGRIDEFTVTVRPLSAAQALSEAMAAQFERIRQEVASGHA
jgi:hypothetical protein